MFVQGLSGKCADDDLQNRPTRWKCVFLRHISEAKLPSHRELPIIRLLEPGNDFQQRRFSRAIWANEAGAVFSVEADGDAIEQKSPAKGFAERLTAEKKTHRTALSHLKNKGAADSTHRAIGGNREGVQRGQAIILAQT